MSLSDKKVGLPLVISQELIAQAVKPSILEAMLSNNVDHYARRISDPMYRWQGPVEIPASRCARIGHDWDEEARGYPEDDEVTFSCMRCDAVLTYKQVTA